MANNNPITLCDVPWWEQLESENEKDEYCKNKFGISYAEYMQIIESDLPINEMYKPIRKKHS